MEFIKPGANKRVCAYFIDYMILETISLLILAIFLVDFKLLIWLFGMSFKDCVGGQSLGKRAVGTLIIDANGNPASPMEALKRNVIMILPLFPICPIIEFIIMLRDRENGQRLGDRWAETRVTDLKPEIKDGNYLWVTMGLTVVMIMMMVLFKNYMDVNHPEWMKQHMLYRQAVSAPGNLSVGGSTEGK